MSIVDANGRLFGRWNLIDALLVIFLAGLVPLGYGAYALFQAPLPSITKITPSAMVSADVMRVKVQGDNLRPYLRVSIGTTQGINFLFNSTHEAEAEFAKLAPGVYDVILYDFQQQRSLLKDAFTVLPSPLPPALVQMVGSFGNLKPEQVKQVQPGLVIPGVGEVLRVGKPGPDLTRVFAGAATVEIPIEKTIRLPVVLKVGCQLPVPQATPLCYGNGLALQPIAIVELATAAGKMLFQVEQVIGLQKLEPLHVRVRFTGVPEALAQLKVGDVDLGTQMNELAAGARIVGVTPVVSGQRDTEILLQGQRLTSGWSYAAMPIRIGGTFYLRTGVYELSGTVVGVTAPAGDAPKP